MITQTIKKWLHKILAWWQGKEYPEIEYSHITSASNLGTTQPSASVSAIEGITPQTGSTPRFSTVENWSERVAQSSFPPANERIETPPSTPLTPPLDKTKETPLNPAETAAFVVPPSPMPQHQLEFLQYLVKRGIVNEGFEEDHIPEQYRRM